MITILMWLVVCGLIGGLVWWVTQPFPLSVRLTIIVRVAFVLVVLLVVAEVFVGGVGETYQMVDLPVPR